MPSTPNQSALRCGFALVVACLLSWAALGAAEETSAEVTSVKPARGWKFDRDFTVLVSFTTTSDGALFALCRPAEWEPDAKMLGIRDGRLFYDVGWVGCVEGHRDDLHDGHPHTAVVRFTDGNISLYLDGAHEETLGLGAPADRPEHGLHLGTGAHGFVGDLEQGTVAEFRYWSRALTDEEIERLYGKQPEPTMPEF